jgi:dolichyl-phosphate beta-glucosyltransferase
MSLSVIVPVYNEEKHLLRLLTAQLKGLYQLGLPFELIVSENGSRDGTLALVNKLAQQYPEIRVITSPNANYGLAVRRGFLAARNQYLVLFDLDYWDFNWLRRALAQLPRFDAVVASKNLPGANDSRPLFRRLATAVFSGILRLFFGLELTDTHGIKVLRRQTFRPLIAQTVFNQEIFDSELLIRGQLAGLRLTEIGINVRERRPSKTPLLARAVTTLKHLWRLRQLLVNEGLL